MSSRKFVSAFAAVALIAAPTMAAAQSVQAPLAPAAETVEGSEMRDGDSGVGQLLPLIIIIALVFLIREIVKDRDIGERDPRSP